jgi:hypothetical protein
MMIDKSVKAGNVTGSAIVSGSVGRDIVVSSQNTLSTEGQKSLTEAASEIQELLDQLSETYPTKTAFEKSTVAVKAMEGLESKPSTKKKILGVLKAGGVAALTELIDNPIVNILTPMFESWIEEES